MRKYLFIALGLLASIVLTSCLQDECNGVDSCYLDKALASNDVFYCSLIKLEPVQRSCQAEIAIAADDLNSCVRLNSSYCTISIAQKRDDFQVCDEIDEAQLHDTCHAGFALNKTNLTLCKNVDSDDTRDQCFIDIAYAMNQTEVCFNIINRETRDICIARRAISLKNSNDCYYINDLMTKSLCYLRIAEKTKKLSVCENIQMDSIKKDCLDIVNKDQLSS
jgi:hypothetical protein